MAVLAPQSSFVDRPGKGQDPLERAMESMASPGALEAWREGERGLRDYVEAEARNFGTEELKSFMSRIYDKISVMVAR